MDKMIMIPFDKLAELMEKNYVLVDDPKAAIDSLIKENAELKATVMKLQSEALVEQHATKMKREQFMQLADIVKAGRLHDEPDALETVERYLRREAFGPIDTDKITQDLEQQEGME